MKQQTVAVFGHYSLLGLLAICTHISQASPTRITGHSTIKDLQSSTGQSSSIADSSTTFAPSSYPNPNGISSSPNSRTNFQSRRIKRDALAVKSGMADINSLFPSNIDDAGIQKWIQLLRTKPKNIEWSDECEYYDDCDDYYLPPAIDLVKAKKPGHVDDSNVYAYTRGQGVYAGDLPSVDPILLQQHHMNKKSRYATVADFIPQILSSKMQWNPRPPQPSRSLFSRFAYAG